MVSFSLAFFSVALGVYILWAASAFFIPLVVALVISYLIIAIVDWIDKLTKMPRIVSYFATLGVFLLMFYFIYIMVQNNVTALLESAPGYQEKLNSLIETIFGALRLDPPKLEENFSQFDFRSLIQQIVLTITDIAGQAGVIFIYVIFILIEYGYYDTKLEAFFREEKHQDTAKTMIRRIASQIKSYLRIKTLFSLLTAMCSYGVLVLVGVDFAEFWAFLIFLLNYIPTIGSIIATVFPCLLTLLQFGELVPFLIVAAALILIQFTIGNIIEPKIMGEKFNLSGLVIILFLAIWGQIWGIIGMFLCVPLLMIISIILSNFPQTRPIAVLLSQNGKID